LLNKGLEIQQAVVLFMMAKLEDFGIPTARAASAGRR